MSCGFDHCRGEALIGIRGCGDDAIRERAIKPAEFGGDNGLSCSQGFEHGDTKALESGTVNKHVTSGDGRQLGRTVTRGQEADIVVKTPRVNQGADGGGGPLVRSDAHQSMR